MSKENQFFATCPKGLELLLVQELLSLGATHAAEKLAGVTFRASLNNAYKICLWSRLANRILLPLYEGDAGDPEQLYKTVQRVKWSEHLTPRSTFAVHCICSQSNINHSLYAAQKVKDAIVDQMRAQLGERPNVDTDQPDVSVYVYIHRDKATINIDLSGDSLHKRGFRLDTGAAPLKENLAAAILIRAGWPEIAKAGGALMDPMCGSGTLLIEGAMMAANIAPGLQREYFGFLGWKQFEPNTWRKLLNEAEAAIDLESLPPIVGYDINPEAIKVAFANIERAGLLGKVHVEKRDLPDFVPKAGVANGLVVVNPPYGERLGDEEELQPLYTLLGDRLKAGFEGWKAAVFTGNPDLGKKMGLRAKKFYALFNGAIPCKLLLFDVEARYFIDRSGHVD